MGHVRPVERSQLGEFEKIFGRFERAMDTCPGGNDEHSGNSGPVGGKVPVTVDILRCWWPVSLSSA